MAEKHEHSIEADLFGWVLLFAVLMFGLNQCTQCEHTREQTPGLSLDKPKDSHP